MNRREFVTLVGVGGAATCLPEVVSAATEGVKQAKRPDGFVTVGTVKELDQKGELLNKQSPVGPILLLKEPGSSKIIAVNPTCTHEGCTVKVKEKDGQNILACPCHKGFYTMTGVVTGGKPKRNLQTYQVKVEGNNILVKA